MPQWTGVNVELMEKRKRTYLTSWGFIKIFFKKVLSVEMKLSGFEKVFRDAKGEKPKMHTYHLYRVLNEDLLSKTKQFLHKSVKRAHFQASIKNIPGT